MSNARVYLYTYITCRMSVIDSSLTHLLFSAKTRSAPAYNLRSLLHVPNSKTGDRIVGGLQHN
jgi:hypothetical protein